MTEPTKDPWLVMGAEVEIGGELHYSLFVTNKDNESVASGIKNPENANRIAAAPDMLAALEAYLKDFDCVAADCGMVSCRLARAAIAKARGES